MFKIFKIDFCFYLLTWAIDFNNILDGYLYKNENNTY